MLKTVILAGGLGTRLSEETINKPKPMVEIGGQPILWHIMKIYAAHGVKEFIICAGYMQYLIKEFFANYGLHRSDITFDLKTGERTIHRMLEADWKVTVIDTGAETMTGGRVKRIQKYLNKDEPFFLTYGDGVSDINITKLLEHHKKMKKTVTISAVVPPARFGQLDIRDGIVKNFAEKPKDAEGYVNGGFMVVEPKFIDYIEGDKIMLEREPMEKVTAENEVTAFIHDGFWQPMDKLHDKLLLEKLWESGKAPWKVWK
jgi:glucose-1-phosphate cytidylyltransferase